jgi:hypothetical protein
MDLSRPDAVADNKVVYFLINEAVLPGILHPNISGKPSVGM